MRQAPESMLVMALLRCRWSWHGAAAKEASVVAGCLKPSRQLSRGLMFEAELTWPDA
jgi:hypothetical protein